MGFTINHISEWLMCIYFPDFLFLTQVIAFVLITYDCTSVDIKMINKIHRSIEKEKRKPSLTPLRLHSVD